MAEALYNKYRPTEFAEVVGQDAAVKALEQAITNMHAFLLCGPSGVGKTTLARICAAEMGVEDTGRIDVDAADNTGVEDMRKILENIQYRAFGATGKKAIIIDEAHRLSGNAWDSLLKALEEPPVHVAWFLCTTNLNKVPNTIRTRCAAVHLKEVSTDDLKQLYDAVCEAEKFKIPDDVGTLVMREAHGSPRQMLVNMEMCHAVRSKKEAAQILQTVLETDKVAEFCRFVLAGGSWRTAMAHIEELKDENPEGVRIVTCHWISKALRGAKSDDQAMRLLSQLEHFSTPYNSAEGHAPLILSIGRCLFVSE